MDTIKIKAGQTKMIAHRGLSSIERENTCPAFVAAGNRSYFGIETDVHVTRDGQFVIIHDETTGRVCQGEVDIDVENNDYTLLESIVLPDLDGSKTRRDIRIPLLDEYVSICKKYEKTCVLEIKNHFEPSDLQRLVERIRALDYIEHVIFISFDFDNCVNVRKLLPQNSVQWLIVNQEINAEMASKLREHRLDLDAHHKYVRAQDVALLHDNGIKINCWTCDDSAEAESLIACGVDFITTNILE